MVHRRIGAFSDKILHKLVMCTNMKNIRYSEPKWNISPVFGMGRRHRKNNSRKTLFYIKKTFAHIYGGWLIPRYPFIFNPTLNMWENELIMDPTWFHRVPISLMFVIHSVYLSNFTCSLVDFPQSSIATTFISFICACCRYIERMCEHKCV